MSVTERRARALPVLDYSLCCALGTTKAEALAALRDGRSGLGRAPFSLEFPAPTGVVTGPLPKLPRAFTPYQARQAQLALAALEPLLGTLDTACNRFGPERVAVILGSSNAGLDVTERSYATHLQTGSLPEGYSLRTQHDFAAVLALVRALSRVRGPASFVSTACSSSAKAFAAGSRFIEAGLADAVLVGGVDALCEMTLRGFRGLGVLAEEPCRPFGLGRSGTSIGEGAAMFLLAREGDGPCALLGSGETADAHHMTAPHPEGRGAESAMRAALAAAGLAPEAIDLINAHGTGTPQGDAIEAEAIARVFGACARVVTTKGYTGHALGAAGAVEAALTLLMLEHGFAPASLGADPIDSALPVSIVREREERRFAHALSNSFAFGGSNASLVFGRCA